MKAPTRRKGTKQRPTRQRSVYAGLSWWERPAWHFWHETLVSIGDSSLAARRRLIREVKMPFEVPIRLQRLAYVRGRLPQDVLKVLRENVGFGSGASMALHRLPSASLRAILRLHARECPGCPWDGQTLFPERLTDA